MNRHLRFAALAALTLTPTAFAVQDVEGEEPMPEINPFREQAQPSPQDQMIQLFHEVEQNLTGATDLLFDAAQGDLSALDAVDGAGIEDIEPDDNGGSGGGRGSLASLLTATSAEGESVLSGIDAIIELAQQSGGS